MTQSHIAPPWVHRAKKEMHEDAPTLPRRKRMQALWERVYGHTQAVLNIPLIRFRLYAVYQTEDTDQLDLILITGPDDDPVTVRRAFNVVEAEEMEPVPCDWMIVNVLQTQVNKLAEKAFFVADWRKKMGCD